MSPDSQTQTHHWTCDVEPGKQQTFDIGSFPPDPIFHITEIKVLAAGDDLHGSVFVGSRQILHNVPIASLGYFHSDERSSTATIVVRNRGESVARLELDVVTR